MGRMKLHRPRSPTLAAALAGVARLAALTAAVAALSAGCGGPSEAQPADSALEGLASPRGLTALDDGRLLIAEVGGGRLLILDRQNRLAVLHEGLPRLKDGPEGAPAGVSAAVQLGGITYYVVGEARAKEFREVYALAPGSHPVGLTGQDPLGLAPLNPITNPYDLLPAPSGGLLVSDAGANAVWRVTLAGEIHPYARLDPQTHATADGSAQVEAVPTGIALGPDGAAYVATLTGFPFPTGGARVLRLQDDNGDGDALDLGETTVYADGFTAATDVAFEADGAMLVTEYSGDMRSLAEVGFKESHLFPGRLVRWRDGVMSVVADGLVSPTAVAVARGRIYVSEEFAGRVHVVEP